MVHKSVFVIKYFSRIFFDVPHILQQKFEDIFRKNVTVKPGSHL